MPCLSSMRTGGSWAMARNPSPFMTLSMVGRLRVLNSHLDIEYMLFVHAPPVSLTGGLHSNTIMAFLISSTQTSNIANSIYIFHKMTDDFV